MTRAGRFAYCSIIRGNGWLMGPAIRGFSAAAIFASPSSATVASTSRGTRIFRRWDDDLSVRRVLDRLVLNVGNIK